MPLAPWMYRDCATRATDALGRLVIFQWNGVVWLDGSVMRIVSPALTLTTSLVSWMSSLTVLAAAGVAATARAASATVGARRRRPCMGREAIGARSVSRRAGR